ncbi:hypothetical protein LCGC14_0194890 [marine sediment metagenome]|uniref:Uncharacterized protein n=1 Tax=marine sediment metagenome TaxID=412755 RepID=A0A0F9V1Q8_9ZZZZ
MLDPLDPRIAAMMLRILSEKYNMPSLPNNTKLEECWKILDIQRKKYKIPTENFDFAFLFCEAQIERLDKARN